MLSCLSVAASRLPAGIRAGLLVLLHVKFLVFCHFPMWCLWSDVVFYGIDS